jgi:ketosteroid isomerase-like protein
LRFRNAETISLSQPQQREGTQSMQLVLDAPISSYFTLSNEHQAEALAGLFTEDARVHDEHSDHRGREAIRDWADDTFRKYGTHLDPRDARDEGDATVVTTGVSGDFPGSPIELDCRFVTEGERIKELEIA